MTRKMTVVFHDEDLYTYLKVEAARRHIAASDIVAAAVQEWLDAREDEALVPLVEAAEAEYKEKGGKPWSDVERENKTTSIRAGLGTSTQSNRKSGRRAPSPGCEKTKGERLDLPHQSR